MELHRGSLCDLLFEKFSTSSSFSHWETNFKTEVMFLFGSPEGGNAVELANSIDDLPTSQSITERVYPISQTLDARIETASTRTTDGSYFKEKDFWHR